MILIALDMALGVRPMPLRILQQKNTVEIDQDEAARRLHRCWDRHHTFLHSPIPVKCLYGNLPRFWKTIEPNK